MEQRKHKWLFRNRLYRHAIGSRLQQGIKKIELGIAEIKKIGTKSPVLAADGAVLFFQRISPAVENADVTSPALQQVITKAIKTLVPVIGRARTNPKQRKRWLTKLLEAHDRDQGLVLESLTDYFGDMCGTPEAAWEWADRLLPRTRRALRRNNYFHATTACLSAMLKAERFEELVDLVQDQAYWRYKVWAVRACLSLGDPARALELAESSRQEQESDKEVNRMISKIRNSMK